VEWTVTQDWTGDKNPKTKRKVRTFRGLSTDEFHLECKYSKYCEENGHGTTAYWLYNQLGNVVERGGWFCCEQGIYSNIDDWTLIATSKPLSSDADLEIPDMSAVEESTTFQDSCQDVEGIISISGEGDVRCSDIRIPSHYCNYPLSRYAARPPEGASYDETTTYAMLCPVTLRNKCSINEAKCISKGMSAVEESTTFQVLRRVPTVQILAIIGALSMVFCIFRAFLPQEKYEEIQDEAI
jgi:hypothetical protein